MADQHHQSPQAYLEYMGNQLGTPGWNNVQQPSPEMMAMVQMFSNMWIQNFREGKWKRLRKMVAKFFTKGIMGHVLNFLMMVASGGLLGMLGL
ncbi:hypothetical protein BDV93DRAFT_555311 [Ceratobasidium sp. AG-I]|nr:hypothetical protein BDV93DRAFT_555311 [Ceratobasidium sp. AG-I]